LDNVRMVGGSMGGWMEGWRDGGIDGWMDGWMEGWMEGMDVVGLLVPRWHDMNTGFSHRHTQPLVFNTREQRNANGGVGR
jgi:hypothetical protein